MAFELTASDAFFLGKVYHCHQKTGGGSLDFYPDQNPEDYMMAVRLQQQGLVHVELFPRQALLFPRQALMVGEKQILPRTAAVILTPAGDAVCESLKMVKT